MFLGKDLNVGVINAAPLRLFAALDGNGGSGARQLVL